MIQEQDRFWLIWSPTGNTVPRAKHWDERAAIIEAERLARMHPGQEFVVMKSQTARIIDNMIHVEYVDELPF